MLIHHILIRFSCRLKEPCQLLQLQTESEGILYEPPGFTEVYQLPCRLPPVIIQVAIPNFCWIYQIKSSSIGNSSLMGLEFVLFFIIFGLMFCSKSLKMMVRMSVITCVCVYTHQASFTNDYLTVNAQGI